MKPSIWLWDGLGTESQRHTRGGGASPTWAQHYAFRVMSHGQRPEVLPWGRLFPGAILHRGLEAESQRPSRGGGVGLKAMGLSPNGPAGAAVQVAGGPNTMHFVV